MRILIVSQYFWPENFRINDLALELSSRGHAVDVVTGVPNYPSGKVFEEYKRNKERFKKYHSINVFRSAIVPRGKGSFQLVLNYLSFAISASLKIVTLRKNKYDVVFMYGPSPATSALPGVLFGKLTKTPVVYWVLDLWPDTLSALGVVQSKFSLMLVDRFIQWIYNSSALILGQSHSITDTISERYFLNRKTLYYPSWAESVFDSSHVKKTKLIPESPDIFTLMFAGNIGEAQDFESVVKAIDLLRGRSDVRWVFVGDGSKYKWLSEVVKERGLQKQVLLLGRHPLEDMSSFYSHADAMLVSLKKAPVFSLTVPGKIQSYLAAGIPILGMLDGEGARIINESKSGIACGSGEFQELSDNILKILSQSSIERKSYGENGRRYSREEFDRNKLISTLESRLTSVLP